MHNHTGYICLSFLHCDFSNGSSNDLPERMHKHKGCICLSFLHCAFSNVSSKHLDQSRHNHIGCICLIFTTVHFQMSPQIACLRGCVITLVAFTWPHPSFITVLGSSQFRVFNVFFHHYWVLKNICEEKGKVGVLTSTPLMYPRNWCGLRSVFCGNILTKVRV